MQKAQATAVFNGNPSREVSICKLQNKTRECLLICHYFPLSIFWQYFGGISHIVIVAPTAYAHTFQSPALVFTEVSWSMLAAPVPPQDLLSGKMDLVMPSTFITQPDCAVYQLS